MGITKNFYCAQKLEEEIIFKILQEDHLYKKFRHEGKVEYDSKKCYEFFSSESKLYGPMYRKDCSLKRSRMMFDVRSWDSLALMSQSLDWLAERLFKLMDSDTWSQKNQFVHQAKHSCWMRDRVRKKDPTIQPLLFHQ